MPWRNRYCRGKTQPSLNYLLTNISPGIMGKMIHYVLIECCQWRGTVTPHNWVRHEGGQGRCRVQLASAHHSHSSPLKWLSMNICWLDFLQDLWLVPLPKRVNLSLLVWINLGQYFFLTEVYTVIFPEKNLCRTTNNYRKVKILQACKVMTVLRR